jgi:hypothetical protein
MAFDSSMGLFVGYSAFISQGAGNRGVYATNDDGATWDYAGLDGYVLRGLVGATDGMYAFTSRGTYKLSREPLKNASILLNKHTIDFDTVDVNGTKDTVVTVTNSGNDTLRVTGYRYSPQQQGAHYSVTPQQFNLPPGGTRDIIIRFSPESGGVHSATMRPVSNTSPDTIYLTGIGRAANVALHFENTTIDMGNVPVNSTRDSVVKVTNTGTQSLVVSNVTSTDPSITVTPTAFTIAATDSQNITVRFKPTSTNSVIATLTFINNGPSASLRVIGVGGIASVEEDAYARELKMQILPNPVSSDAKVKFTLTRNDNVTLSVVDETGKTVTTISKGDLGTGEYSFDLASATFQSSGLYFVRLITNHGSATISAIVTK